MIVASVATIVLFAFLCHQLWHMQAARWLIVIGFILFLSNPVTEHAKQTLISDAGNYLFVASDQPYQFKSEAWLQLWVVDHLQEASEVGGTICILALALLKGSSLSHMRRSRPVEILHRGEARVRQHRT